MIRDDLVKRVVLNDLVRCPGCGAAVEDGKHVDSGQVGCGWVTA